jgi:hypothetical protein
LFILVRNTNTVPLAAVTFRVRVKNRKGDVWSTEHLAIQRLAPGEMRSVETTLFVSEYARARRAAFVELTGIVCPVELVQPLVEIVPTISVEAAAEDEGAASAGGLDLNDENDDTANGSGLTIWEPKGGGPGIWTFYPNAKLRNDYPDCDRDRTGLDCQRGEVLSLIPETTERRGSTLVVNIAQGRVELRDFDRCWEELRRPPDEDCVVWDIYRIVEEWSSE